MQFRCKKRHNLGYTLKQIDFFFWKQRVFTCGRNRPSILTYRKLKRLVRRLLKLNVIFRGRGDPDF